MFSPFVLSGSLCGASPTLKGHMSVLPTGSMKRTMVKSRNAVRISSSLVSEAPSTDLGNKLGKFLQSPFDYAAFGPRATLGAVVSLPKVAENFQQELDKLNMLFQDPRPLPEKQQILVEELESRLAEYVEVGISLEADILANANAALPQELQAMVPQELKNFYGRPLGAAAPVVDTSVNVGDTTVTVVTTDAPAWTVPPTSFKANQSAAEIVDLKDAVEALNKAVDALSYNSVAGGSEEAILRMNLADSRDSLARRLQQLSLLTRNSQDPSVQSAIKESTKLVSEVDELGL